MTTDQLPNTTNLGEKPDAAPANILVVDDTEANREVLGRRLERRGYRVTSANDGTEALQRIADERFDLILLDVMMPGISGFDVLERLRKTYSPTDLPIIMATAKDESVDIVKAFELGANDYVTKPLDFGVVMARVRTQLTIVKSVRQIKELEKNLSERNAALEAAMELTRRDLQAAARVQAAFLPRSTPDMDGFRFAWRLVPCQELAGDSLNIARLDADHVGLYVLDVSGHGVAAALPAVAATRLLSASREPDTILLHNDGEANAGKPLGPAEVAGRLDRWFKSNPDTHQFITFFYAQVNTKTRELTYVSAAHPPAVVLLKGKGADLLRGSGLPIGLGDGYEEFNLPFNSGDRVYLYSDGVPEAFNADHDPYGMDRMLATLERNATKTLKESVDALLDDITRWCGDVPFHDDISIVAVECI